LDGTGNEVGPDLAALTSKSSASLLVAILDPNRDVDGRYVSYLAELADGRTVSGLLAGESGASVTLREQEGKEHILLRADLESLRATGKSAMPEGLEKDMTLQEMADVIAFLLAPRTSPKQFAGNQPQAIVPSADGSLALLAAQAEIFGGEIMFESNSPYRNIGYWHGLDDFAGWQVQLERPGRFEVYLDHACAQDSAGNGFRFEGAEPTLRGTVSSTGQWSNYRALRIGTIELSAGRSYLTLRYDGERKAHALLDLRGVHLIPPGTSAKFLTSAEATDADVGDPAEIARRLLDDAHPADARQTLIADHPQQAAAIITAMTADLPQSAENSPEEYRRIPWIWRVAIASGKRNQTEELRAVLDAAMPSGGRPLRDWQAVVIGGGIINGVSQAGDWPKARLEEVLKVEGPLVARWQRSIELAAAMADDEKVPTGTRYDALRMIALGSWDLRGKQLEKYLAPGVHDELQMGAVSGLADMPAPQAAQALLSRLPHLSPRNRDLALDGLLRSEERCQALLAALEEKRLEQRYLGEAHRKRLLEHADATIRARAAEVLNADR
jgi:putative heme-binding domain-containing protein